jgi:hypothetical protein
MSYVLIFAGFAQIAVGFFIVFVARSAMHETTAAVAIGMGFLALGLGRLLQYREDEEKARKVVESRSSTSPLGDVITTYKMYDIRRASLGVSAGGNHFPSIAKAKEYIDGLEKASG